MQGKKSLLALVILLLVALVLGGCQQTTGGDGGGVTEVTRVVEVNPEGTPAAAGGLSDVEGVKTIVQAPVGVAPGEESVNASDWDTEWSLKFNIRLLEVFDSSGEAAWDPTEHPLVYISSEGPGYSGLLSSNVVLPGFMIIDAATRETVAAPHFDLGQEEYFEPHGLGVSPGGEWIYVPTGASASWGGGLGGGRLLIINARTLKIDRILATQGNPHHIKSFVDAQGRELVLVENFSDSTFYVLDPNDDNRVVGGIDGGLLRGSGYLSFAHPSGQYVFISVRTAFGSEGGIAVVDTESWAVKTFIDTLDSSPIYVAFSADGTTAYVSGGHESTVVKIDISNENPRAWGLSGYTSAGTLGPYGLTLNWDETQLYAIGKGEGAHNQGNTIGLIDPNIMTMPPRGWAPGAKASYFTDCIRGDHALVNPDPDMNEMWISCNANFRTVIWDFDKLEIKEILPTPNGGSTHNGAFVHYNADFSGEVLSDQNGLQGSALALKLEMLAKAAASQ
jgi:DNA-binding beta-propeller fold protein YncE/predicted small secreted protein